MKKHTKGPWKVKTFGSLTTIVRESDTTGIKENIVIATVNDRVEGPTSCLIAAAPELIEALELIFVKLEEKYCYDSFGNLDKGAQREFYNSPEILNITKALKKARGES